MKGISKLFLLLLFIFTSVLCAQEQIIPENSADKFQHIPFDDFGPSKVISFMGSRLIQDGALKDSDLGVAGLTDVTDLVKETNLYRAVTEVFEGLDQNLSDEEKAQYFIDNLNPKSLLTTEQFGILREISRNLFFFYSNTEAFRKLVELFNERFDLLGDKESEKELKELDGAKIELDEVVDKIDPQTQTFIKLLNEMKIRISTNKNTQTFALEIILLNYLFILIDRNYIENNLAIPSKLEVIYEKILKVLKEKSDPKKYVLKFKVSDLFNKNDLNLFLPGTKNQYLLNEALLSYAGGKTGVYDASYLYVKLGEFVTKAQDSKGMGSDFSAVCLEMIEVIGHEIGINPDKISPVPLGTKLDGATKITEPKTQTFLTILKQIEEELNLKNANQLSELIIPLNYLLIQINDYYRNNDLPKPLEALVEGIITKIEEQSSEMVTNNADTPKYPFEIYNLLELRTTTVFIPGKAELDGALIVNNLVISSSKNGEPRSGLINALGEEVNRLITELTSGTGKPELRKVTTSNKPFVLEKLKFIIKAEIAKKTK